MRVDTLEVLPHLATPSGLPTTARLYCMRTTAMLEAWEEVGIHLHTALEVLGE